MSDKAPAFQFYASDFLGSTRVMLMTNEQVGAYMFLLCHSWNIGGLPDDDRVLAHLARIPLEEWNELGINKIMGCFFRDEETGLLHNEKLEKVRADLGKYKKKLSDAGKRGAKKRWNDDSHPNGQANSHPNGSPSPSSTPKESTYPHTPKGEKVCVELFFSLGEALELQFLEWQEDNPRKRRFAIKEKKLTELRFAPDERMQRLGKCFSRDPDTKWNYYEAELFREINPTLEDCRSVDEFYSHRPYRDFETRSNEWKADLVKLLEEWNQQLDRANVLIADNDAQFGD
jgi:uncharacterized protein YdaU (DUF1376 family)